ncbi:MAG: HPr family phosphocarrier protein [bacterium]|nr:HPr family phosphocarrier protein [bacterium]
MIKIPVDMSRHMPITRDKALVIATAAGRYECTLTLENNGVVLNLKSMIGLLSQAIPKDGRMVLIADGEDEVEAADEVTRLLA